MRFAAVVAAAWAFAGCGDHGSAPPDAPPGPDQVVAELEALPGVTAQVVPTADPGVTYIVLEFTQPVDHDDPNSATFQQEVSLLHRDVGAPMIVHTSGYWDYYLDDEVELTEMFSANQISIEHRFFGTSRPDPADWSKLTIAQMAADEHAIIAALQTIYRGPFVTTGGSKGGMTAAFHRRFYPSDVVGTVPYVAPLSFGAPDERYPAFVAAVGTPACHQAVRDLAVEMLQNRRAMLEAQATTEAAQEGYGYTRIAIGPAVESAVDQLEWSFWQYHGVDDCPNVPATSALDADVWAFLGEISPVSDSDDDQSAEFEAYVYQAYFQLGFPDGVSYYLTPYEIYADSDYNGAFPVGVAQPTFDGGTAMRDIDTYVQSSGDKLIFIYGQWDPWTGGAFTLGSATNSLELIAPMGTHNADIGALSIDDEANAIAELEQWTGVTASLPQGRIAPRHSAPHVPPAALRALRSRRY